MRSRDLDTLARELEGLIRTASTRALRSPRSAARALALAAILCLAAGTACGEPADEAAAVASEAASAGGGSGVEAIDAFIASQSIDKSARGWKERLPKPPKVAFENGKKYVWLLDTNVGALEVELMPEVAPMHVSSTIYLTRLGFYDDVPFHRVITGFMAQGGDPTGSGRGGPGYSYAGEFSPGVRHDKKGLLSMANAGPGTDGSQFFLTFVPTPHLDGKHTIFGQVTKGSETLDALEQRGSRGGRPTEPLLIETAKIEVR